MTHTRIKPTAENTGDPFFVSDTVYVAIASVFNTFETAKIHILFFALSGGSVAEWLAYWTQAQ